LSKAEANRGKGALAPDSRLRLAADFATPDGLFPNGERRGSRRAGPTKARGSDREFAFWKRAFA
jgi:hypothetical protein